MTFLSKPTRSIVRLAFCTLALALGCKSSDTPAVREPTLMDKESPDTPISDRLSNARAAVAHADRPQADRQTDQDRRPAEIMDFFEVAAGSRVAELMAGRGYYSELLGHAVGPKGKVYVQNNAFVVERFAKGPLAERLARLGLSQLERVDAELDALPFEAESVDVALMIIFYHDTYWLKIDRAAMNAQVFKALVPGGVYGVVDHQATTGTGSDAAETLHRVERALVEQEILAAGFVLDAESDLLTHAEDDHSLNVFDPAIRRKTDRFVLRFRKPLSASTQP